MKLEIIKGETGQSCGIASLRSVFKYYGKEASEEEISKFNKIKNNINWIYDLGFTALKFGFTAKIIDYNYFIYNDFKIENLKEYLQANNYQMNAKDASESAIEFLEEGGEIEAKIFTLKDIKKALDNNTPVILRVKPKIYMGKGRANNLHYIVIEDYDENGFNAMDPIGRKIKLNPESLLYSAYSNFAQMLIIKKK
jgi:ABC-type bacteriocin/lantibiotic exporter with double-glycine peptidase domain